jgi:hypothetical protein
MLGELVVILIILITVAFIYLKGTVIKAFLLLINALVASTIAFAYFETLGKLIIGRNIIVQWALPAALLLIFALALAILHGIGDKLTAVDISFLGNLADRLVRCLMAAFAGFVIAGVVLTVIAMAPIGTKLPYERFQAESKITGPEPDKKLILSADSFVTNFASWLSRGSMSCKKSLATFHPKLINEIYLNRIACDKDNLPVTGAQGISVKAAWNSETELLSALDKQPISATSGKKAVIVRAGINGKYIGEGGVFGESSLAAFTMSQFRLVCKNSDSADNLGGGGQVLYPAGVIRGTNIIDLKNLSDKITIPAADFSSGIKWLDLVFYVPTDTVPVMLQFKQNAVASVEKLVSGENIPPPL